MNNIKTGIFISTLRKNINLTQKELADQLGVTDKAISKWERGAGYPDISMLKPLSEALGVSINELLEGEKREENTLGNSINQAEEVKEDEDQPIINALEYADKIIKNKEHIAGKIVSAIIAISLFIAIFVCVIVNVAVNHSLTWSYIVIGSCVLGGGLVIPPLLVRKKGFLISLCFLTVSIMPFLALLQYCTNNLISTGANPNEWVWSMAFPISATWIIFAWLMVLLYKLIKINIWFIIGIGALLCIPCEVITNKIVDEYVYLIDNQVVKDYSTESSIIVLIAAAGIFIVIGLMRKNRNVK